MNSRDEFDTKRNASDGVDVIKLVIYCTKIKRKEYDGSRNDSNGAEGSGTKCTASLFTSLVPKFHFKVMK